MFIYNPASPCDAQAGSERARLLYIYLYPYLSIYLSIYCRDGGNTFTPKRYRLELNSAHTFTGRQAPSDPHTISGVFFLRKQK